MRHCRVGKKYVQPTYDKGYPKYLRNPRTRNLPNFKNGRAPGY